MKRFIAIVTLIIFCAGLFLAFGLTNSNAASKKQGHNHLCAWQGRNSRNRKDYSRVYEEKSRHQGYLQRKPV